MWQKFLTKINPESQIRIIDATCGNGLDTIFLAKLLPSSHIYSMDIQKRALEKANAALQGVLEPHASVTFVLSSHETFPITEAHLIVYNLGYLPGGDKSITTLETTTLKSIDSALKTVTLDGAISITCYPGHPEGEKEMQAIKQFSKKLPHPFQATWYEWGEKRPSLLWICRF